MSLNQSFISDFSEYSRCTQRTKIKYKLHYGLLSLSNILTGICTCIFSKIFKQMQVLQKQKEICRFSACVLHSVKTLL